MSKTYEPMSGVASQRCRNIVEQIDRTEIDRKEAFDARNAAQKTLDVLGDQPSPERDQTLQKFAEHVLAIRRLDQDIKFLEGELKQTIRKEREPGLWETAEVQIPRHEHKPAAEPDAPTEPPQDTGAAQGRPGELVLQFPGMFVFVSHQEGISGCTEEIQDRPRLDAKVRALCGTANLTFDPHTGLVYDGGRHLLTVMNAAEQPAKKRKGRR